MTAGELLGDNSPADPPKGFDPRVALPRGTCERDTSSAGPKLHLSATNTPSALPLIHRLCVEGNDGLGNRKAPLRRKLENRCHTARYFIEERRVALLQRNLQENAG